jgi:hypothetical protein
MSRREEKIPLLNQEASFLPWLPSSDEEGWRLAPGKAPRIENNMTMRGARSALSAVAPATAFTIDQFISLAAENACALFAQLGI